MKRDVAATVGYVDSEDGIRTSCHSCAHLDPEAPMRVVIKNSQKKFDVTPAHVV